MEVQFLVGVECSFNNFRILVLLEFNVIGNEFMVRVLYKVVRR